MQLEQLERLRSEDTPRRLTITHTIESNFWILKRALHATHLLKLLDKMCKYKMDPRSIVEDTERTRFCPQTDRRTDRRTDGQGDTSIPHINFVEAGGIISDRIWCNTHLRHTTTERYNNGKGGCFRFDDDNNMSYRYILSITYTEMGQLNTYNPIYCNEN